MKSTSIRPSASLPSLDLGWLSLKDHFIATVGPAAGTGTALKNLLVMADAHIQPRTRFPSHPHKDMEILTWVIEGTLHHKDNKGSDQWVPALSLQLMSARDGIFHAEGNSSDETLRIVQIWVTPQTSGGLPLIATTSLTQSGFQLLAGPHEAPLLLRQEVWLYAAKIQDSEHFHVPPNKFAYALFIGELKLNDQKLSDGDGALLESGTYQVEGTGQVLLIEQRSLKQSHDR